MQEPTRSVFMHLYSGEEGIVVEGTVAAIILVIIGGGFAFRFFYKRTKKTIVKTVQKNNIVGGDQAGRDIIKKG